MANGLPTPKSREQILSEMLTEYVGLTGINDLNTGSVITQFFDVVARSVARTSGDIFQILRDFSVERATGEALNRIGTEERVARNTAQVASGTVKVTDTSFEKISTKIYSGAPAPNIGTSVIKVSDASNWPNSGRLYIGRGTPNIEGPINYIATAPVGAFWEITLDSPTTKFHNISESVILGQGGTRNVPVNTVVSSPGAGATPAVNYSVSSAALLLDGENVNNNVQVTAQEPGSASNAPAGSITEFSTAPFPGAKVINVIPFTTGADEESDDDYRDRIKKERFSRGLGTALAVKNAVLGAQSPDENARVTSNEIDTTNPEQTILYIDNGEGYEEKTEGVGLEFVVDSAIGGEQNFQLQTGGRQTSIAKAFLESSISAPYAIRSLDKLSVLVGGVISEHVFPEGVFKAEGAATAFEVVSNINDNPNLTFEATTSESGTKVIIRAKAEDDEFLQMTSPSSGTDAGPALGFPSNESATVLLYKNRELLNKNGRSAFVVTSNKFSWSTSITDGDTLIISVDKTNFVTYTFKNEDFLADGQFATVSPRNSLESWANVFNNKVTGITAEVNGEQLKITSNLGPKNRASIEISPESDFVAKGMFTEQLGLSSQGNEADFQLSRNTAQIKLNKPLAKGDSLNLGSEFTRAEVQSNPILGGQTTLSDTAYVWFVVDDPNVESVEVGVTSDTFINVLKPGGGIVRYESTSPSAFDNVELGDYVIVWSPDLSSNNRLEGRVHAVTSTTLDLKVTEDEEDNAVIEGPIFFTEGFTVIRTKYTPQKVKIDAGVYNINDISLVINNQLNNATATVDNDEIFVFRTNTESSNGSLFIADFNDPAKSLNLIKNSFSQSINSQIAFFETNFSDRQFPSFVHGKITTDAYADPGDSYILIVDSDEDLAALGLDPSGWVCFNQPYGGHEDVQSTECVEIEKYIGTTISIENSQFYKRGRVDDRFHVLNPYDFGHADSLVAVLDDDPTAKTFEMPLYRTAVTNTTLTANPNNFRAYDKEGGNTEFTEFFGVDFKFDNYKALMQAKNVVDPVSGLNDDAILYRSVEWGRSGEKFGVGYFYPTSPDQTISHIVNVNELVNIKIFLNSGPSRTTTIDGTTEWNVTITPDSPTVDLVTYAWAGVGNDPGLSSINSGDYVSIITTGEFSEANQGAYRVDSATATSFTVKRATGNAETQLNVATLQTSTISFFESADTTAQEIVDYVNTNITNYISASLVQDGTSAIDGSGLITKSTGEDADFAYEYVRFKDGKNYILSSNVDASGVDPQFIFKTPLELPSYNTNTNNAYSFNKEEEVKLIPQTSLQVTEFLNVLAVTGFTTLGDIKSIERNTNVQFSTNTLGSNGAVQIAGGTAGSANAAIEGSTSALGSQNNQKALATILAATANGFHSDQWVKVFASQKQSKTTGINALNSIKISGSNPVVGSSKIEIFNKNIGQRFFGRNRYHTRTRGRTFKVEKHGQFTCFSWDGNGAEPYLTKTVELNDIDTKNVSVAFDSQLSIADYTIIDGSISFGEVAVDDIVEITGFSQEGNDGIFKVLGVSEDGKTLRVRNPNAVVTPGNVNEIQSLTFDAVPSVGDFTLNFDGQITASIPYNAIAADVETALEALSNITDVNVTGDFATGFQIEFAGVNANTDVSNLVVQTNTLDVAINEFERYDFSGISGLELNDTAQIEELDFTGITTANLDDVTTKSFQLGGSYAYLWFNVTDGVNSQSDPGGNGAGIQVDVLVIDDAISIAGKAATAIDTAASGILGLKSASNVNEIITLNYEIGGISNSYDIDSGIISTEITDGFAAKSLQLADSSAYLWFNITDGNNIQSNPSGNGTAIKVDVLIADTASDIVTKAAAAVTSALPVAPIFSSNGNGDALEVFYDFTPTTFGADVSTGAVYTYIQNTTNNITVTEEVKGSISGDFSVTTEIQEGDSVIIGSDFSILNQGIYRLVRKFKDSFYIENPNSIEEEITISDNKLQIINNNPLPVNLTFTNGSDQVTSEENKDWTSIVAEDYFIKVSSEGDDKYYKILSVDNTYTVTLTSVFNEDTITTSAVYVSDEFQNTTYNITKGDSLNRIEWSGNGLEPHFENSKSGDIITLGEDFSFENRGDFHIVESGVKLQEITQIEMARGLDIISGNYCKIYTVDDTSPFHLGYKVTTNGIPGIDVPSAPIPSRTIQVEIDSTDSAIVVAEKTALVLNNTPFDEYFSVETNDEFIIITNVLYGPVENFENVDINGEFSIQTLQQGTRNFASYINIKGVSESNVFIDTDKIELHREAIQFKDYNGAVPGDSFVISDPFLGENNVGSYTVTEVLSDSQIIVQGNMDSIDSTLLDFNFNKVYVGESSPYIGYKQIELIATNPSNLNAKNVIFTTSNQFDKINEIAGVSMGAIGKLEIPTEIVRGVDSYKYNTGLIGEANRIVYGEPRDNTTYPGVAAAGSEIFIKAPLVRRVEVSIDVRVKTGVPFSTIVTEIRNSIAALINSNPVGQPISISNIISNVDAIVGVQAVAISSPQYDAQNDVIRINAGEKALVLDAIADILVSKID